MRKIISFAVAAVLSVPVAANGTVISGTFDFTASGFLPGAPVDPVKGSFTISFDNSASISDTTTGFTLNSVNLTTDAPGVGYCYDCGGFTDTLIVGGLVNGVNGEASGTNDWDLIISNISTTPTFLALTYFQIGDPNIQENTATGSVSRAPVICHSPTGAPVPCPSVPEPATLSLLSLGLAGIGMARRRRNS